MHTNTHVAKETSRMEDWIISYGNYRKPVQDHTGYRLAESKAGKERHIEDSKNKIHCALR